MVLLKTAPMVRKQISAAEESWSGKIFSIDEDLLQGKSILWISASNKPVFTKIELFASDAPFPEVSPLPVPPRRTPVPYPSDDVVMPTQSPNPSALAPTATVRLLRKHRFRRHRFRHRHRSPLRREILSRTRMLLTRFPMLSQIRLSTKHH